MDEILKLSKQLREKADAIAAAIKAGRAQIERNKQNDQKAHEQFIKRQETQKEVKA